MHRTLPSLLAALSIACTSVDYAIEDHLTDLDRDGWFADDANLTRVDCDDADPAVHPVADEVCDGRDQDCDGRVDEGTGSTYFADGDGDGAGDADAGVAACSAPEGFVVDASDCDDTDPTAHPGGLEVCGGGDEDCDGQVDEAGASGEQAWFPDADEDGHGDPTASTTACGAPSGHVTGGDDCDDLARSIWPGAPETCDGVDDDCDGDIDEAGALGEHTWYVDQDGDGYGDPAGPVLACDEPLDVVTNAADCDDGDPALHPETAWYADGDGDGHGDPTALTRSCLAPDRAVRVADDCDDQDPSRHPASDETCDRVDEDCDGLVDEGAPACPLAVAVDQAQLWSVDLGTGDVSSLAPVVVGAYNALTTRSDQELFGHGGGGAIYAIDSCSGETRLVGDIGHNACGLAFDADDTLFSLDSDGALGIVDATTGVYGPIGSIGMDVQNCDLAFDPVSGALVALLIDPNLGRAELYRLDPTTGAASWISTLTNAVAWSGAGLSFDPVTGEAYALAPTGMYRVDLASGAAELLSPSMVATGNLTFVEPACP